MIFSDCDFPEVSQEEINLVKWIGRNNPNDLDSRELWILENLKEGDVSD